MSIDVPLDELADAVRARGPLAYLVTVGEHGPRVVSVSVEVDVQGSLTMDAGRHSAANVADRPAVTVLWPPDDGDPTHTLLVDGSAAMSDGSLVVTPASAILHRVRAGRGRPPG